MQSNGKHTQERAHEFRFPPYPEPAKPQPLAKTEQLTAQIATRMELVRQKQEMELERMLGKIAALNSAKPIIEAVVGNANHNLQQLTRVILERGCDIAEDCIELVIEDDD